MMMCMCMSYTQHSQVARHMATHSSEYQDWSCMVEEPWQELNMGEMVEILI